MSNPQPDPSPRRVDDVDAADLAAQQVDPDMAPSDDGAEPARTGETDAGGDTLRPDIADDESR